MKKVGGGKVSWERLLQNVAEQFAEGANSCKDLLIQFSILVCLSI